MNWVLNYVAYRVNKIYLVPKVCTFEALPVSTWPFNLEVIRLYLDSADLSPMLMRSKMTTLKLDPDNIFRNSKFGFHWIFRVAFWSVSPSKMSLLKSNWKIADFPASVARVATKFRTVFPDTPWPGKVFRRFCQYSDSPYCRH